MRGGYCTTPNSLPTSSQVLVPYPPCHSCSFSLQKVCIGTGVLALPYSFAQGGVLFSAVGLYIIAQWNIYSINRLLLCEKIVKQLPTTGPCRNLSTFSLVALKALGEFGTSLVDYTIGEL